ncbi:MAG: UvrD-helicase domain-containing protein [Hydrogenophaga sp.]|uniref:UvrD-helicase domain-containing protein n=1 Tax=Hydrogenophaga sp. TaxID=1904254 RepID=UPI0027365D58|nr:UvrD-helicase domain-containing protein [Hydrogenophaga sp.]MDP3626930.1 UvrD-helicase domain-containing protein [Hydrogenophaga sp.]
MSAKPGTQPAYRINGVLSDAAAFYRVACDPARSVAVEACAGAGKTWMLVSRILRALLDGCEPQDILAITFTKKAAGEMRQRLQQWLRDFADQPDAQLVLELQWRGLAPQHACAAVPALRALQQRLQQGGRPVQVRTFHSWFASLLRAAPLGVLAELQLPAQYELLEDDSQAVRLVWPRFFAVVTGDEALSTAFHEAVAAHGRSQTLKALTTALSKRVEFALADALGRVDASVAPFGERFPDLAPHADPAHALLGPEAHARWHARSAALGAEKNKTPQKAAQGVVDAFLLPDDVAHAPARLALLRKAFFVATDDRLNTNLLKFEAAQAAGVELAELLAASRQHEGCLHQRRMAQLCRALLQSYAALKRERGWVDMNDIEQAALRLLSDPSLAPWMQQRLDARVRHLLIDEFQDTNPLQWQALHAWLSSYAGAGGGDAPSVFLVGDPQQSIYRFRRAEPQVFRAAQRFVVDGLGGALLSCDHTRRCAPAVVGALNEVMGAAETAGEYAGFRAHSTDSTALGAVLGLSVVPRPERAADSKDKTAWRDSLTTPKRSAEDSLSAHEARQAADWIAHTLQAEGLDPNDVMVLARKRERLGWLHEALRERGVPSEEPEKRDLSDAPAVQDVVALLDVLVSPTQDLGLARALKSPLLGCDDADLAWLAQHSRGADGRPAKPWWQALCDAPPADMSAPLRAAAERLPRWRDWVWQLPPHDTLAAIYRDGDVLAAYARHTPAALRTTVLAQLHAVLAQALAVDGGRCLTPYRLVRALKAPGLTAPVVNHPGAVRLLTVHGAKGLEAHTVLLLDTDSRPPKGEAMGVLVDWPGEDSAPRRLVFLVSEKRPPPCAADLLASEQAARALEELNALYVACTRAEQRLVVSATEPHGDSGGSWFKRLLPVCEAAPVPEPPPRAEAGVDGERFTVPELPPHHWTPQPAEALDDNPVSARLGQAMHRLLQWRPTPVLGFDWTDAHVAAVAREFDLDAAQARQALERAHAVVAGEGAWAWDAQRLDWWDNEVELLDAQGQVMRLDRLVRERGSGHWWVLDHKSATSPERQAALREQLARYAQAVALAQPCAHVRTAFLTADGRCIEVAVPEIETLHAPSRDAASPT